MKISKKIFFITLLFSWVLFSYANLQISSQDLQNNIREGNILSYGYTTSNECNLVKEKYNSKYSGYIRSECFVHEQKFHYFICESTHPCTINGTQTSSVISTARVVPNQQVLDNFLSRVKLMRENYNNDIKYIDFLNNLQSQFTTFSQKYSSNSTLVEMIVYLQSGINGLKISVSSRQDDMNEFKSFLCEFSWGCNSHETEKQSIPYTPNTNISQNPNPIINDTTYPSENTNPVSTFWSCNFTNSKTMYYTVGTSNCISANFYCNNWQMTWWTQFSPMPPKPTTWTKFYDSRTSCLNEGNTISENPTQIPNPSTTISTPINDNTGVCAWTLPTGEWIVSCWANCTDFAPRNTTWKFSSSPTTRCTWWCANGYVRPSLTSNTCIKSDTPIYDGNDVKIEIKVSWNCSQPGASLSQTIWNAWPNIKICKEYQLTTPSRNWESYTCDNDLKFVSASQVWPNGYYSSPSWNKWSKYDTLINHSTIVPWKYRLAVKSADGKVKFSDWYTIASSWPFSNQENCNYTKYKPNSVEDALWFLLNTKWVHWSYWIDFSQISSKCPNIQTEFIRLANNTSWYWQYYQSPSIWWGWRTLWAELSHCYTRQIPTWQWTTFIWDFWSRLNWEKNNQATFDFQSWYNGGNPWALWWSACWNVPSHWKSQFYWWIKWEPGKEFNCSAKTYGGSSSLWNTSWWTTNTTQVFSVTQTKSTLKENWDSISYKVTWLDYDNAMACQSVHAHPNVPSAIDPSRCSNPANYVYLKNANGWSYSNWVWTATMKSNTNIYVSWIKVQSHFRDGRTWSMKSGNIIEIIK